MSKCANFSFSRDGKLEKIWLSLIKQQQRQKKKKNTAKTNKVEHFHGEQVL